MPYILIHHKVQDYAKWKSVFDEHASTRKSGGSKGGWLFQSADNAEEIVIVFEWDTLENARAFTSSDDLRAAMEKAGVAGPPTIVFMEQLETLTT